MKKYKYVGTFLSSDNNRYQLTCYCNGFLEAFILLTADAIKQGKHYQLENIADEHLNVCKVADIIKLNEILSIK